MVFMGPGSRLVIGTVTVYLAYLANTSRSQDGDQQKVRITASSGRSKPS